MKNIIYTLVLIVIAQCSLITDDCLCQWTPTSYFPESGYALASTTGSRVYAGSYKWGVLFSTDNGANWTRTSLVGPNGNDSVMIDAIAANGNYIYAGENGWIYGVHVSTDYGVSWTRTLVTEPIISLAVSGSTVYAGAYGTGVFRSTNNGLNWSQTSLSGQYVNALSISGTNLFAGTTDNGVYITTNSGTNWTKTSLGNQRVLSLATSGSKVYAGTGNGVFYSSNSGSNWTNIGLGSLFVYSIELNGTNVFAGTGSGFYKSTNNGTNWVVHNDGFVDNTALIYSMLVINGFIIAGTEGWGVYRRPVLEVIGIKNISTEIPDKYKLWQNYPNPFNCTSNLKFEIGNLSDVKILVYDLKGRLMQTLVNERLQPGTYETTFDGSEYSSGIYFYRLQTESFSETKKFILLK
ncbi:MAG: T9SS type A sorting domain-containing protein [Paludibacter sp.]